MKDLKLEELKDIDQLSAWVADADVESLFALIVSTQLGAMNIITPCMVAIQERFAAAGHIDRAIQTGRALEAMQSLTRTMVGDE